MHLQVLGEEVSIFHRPLLKYTKDKDVTGNGQLGLVKEEFPFTDFRGFYVELTSSVGDGKQQRFLALPLITNTLNLAFFSPPHCVHLWGWKSNKRRAKEHLSFIGCHDDKE